MDHSRPFLGAASGDSLHQVDQGLPLVGGGGMDDEAGRFVDHDEVVVEVHDHPLGLGPHRRLPTSTRSTFQRSSKTPRTIATSARLKVGQSGRAMKSVTAPSRARAARVPSAPPTSSPAGSPNNTG